MAQKILFTSFETWLPHQPSNSSDDLLVTWQKEKRTLINKEFTYLRHLPVDITRASERTIAAIQNLAPDLIICCGMAESRYYLTVESNGTNSNNKIETLINLPALISQLSHTGISHDAGKFVCEGLYYQVLLYLKQNKPEIPCLFVHVPVLNPTNTYNFLCDFELIVQKKY